MPPPCRVDIADLTVSYSQCSPLASADLGCDVPKSVRWHNGRIHSFSQVTGNGASGGAAGAVATFKVVCKDSKGKRVGEGGAPMMASVAPKSLGAKEVGEQIAVLIKDNGDGSYSGMYTVSARGNYEVGLARCECLV